MSASFDIETNRATLELPILVGRNKKATQETRAGIQQAVAHLALLQFQMLLHELDRHWPPEAGSIRVKARGFSDLGRIELRVASAVPGPEEVDFNAVNAYREAIENFCETLLPECDDLINRAFDSGKREVLRADIPAALHLAVRNAPEQAALLKATRLAKTKKPLVSRKPPRL